MIGLAQRTLVDPIPAFIPVWTKAIELADIMKIQCDVVQTDDFCVYNSKLAERDTRISKIQEYIEHNFIDQNCCLVGEAYKFKKKDYNDQYLDSGRKNPWYCKTCDTLSIQPAFEAVVHGGDVLIKFKVSLWNHMVVYHKQKGNTILKIPEIKK